MRFKHNIGSAWEVRAGSLRGLGDWIRTLGPGMGNKWSRNYIVIFFMISPEGGKSQGWQRQMGECRFNSENICNHFQSNDILNVVTDYQSPMISITLRWLAITHISDFMIPRIIKTRDCNLTPLFWGHYAAAAGFSCTHLKSNSCTSFLVLFHSTWLALRYMVWREARSQIFQLSKCSYRIEHIFFKSQNKECDPGSLKCRAVFVIFVRISSHSSSLSCLFPVTYLFCF